MFCRSHTSRKTSGRLGKPVAGKLTPSIRANTGEPPAKDMQDSVVTPRKDGEEYAEGRFGSRV
jgi:hypothetical protein